MLIRKLATLLLVATLGFVTTSHAASSDFVPELQPDPEYLPAEVVGIQMRALASNNQPFENAGIELTFRFASPTNKAQTGPLSRFTGLFSNTAYQPMLEHSRLEIGEAEIRNDQARVPVMVETIGGAQVVYLFQLSRQTEGEYRDCWMTDSVAPIRMTPGNTTTTM